MFASGSSLVKKKSAFLIFHLFCMFLFFAIFFLLELEFILVMTDCPLGDVLKFLLRLGQRHLNSWDVRLGSVDDREMCYMCLVA